MAKRRKFQKPRELTPAEQDRASRRPSFGHLKAVEMPTIKNEGFTFKDKRDDLGDGPSGGRMVLVRTGWCPCGTCGHEFVWECDDADCQCCSSTCT